MNNIEHTRLVAMEMMNPLFKILGEASRKNGMAYYARRNKNLTKVFASIRKFPTGKFVPASGVYEGEHEGVFGNDRSLYLHVRPSPQRITHVDGVNTRLHLDDEADRPVHPYIEYMQVKPGAANPGPEHAQQVYEALHRQGYTGDTMDFFAPSDSDGRRDKNGLNRRQRLYRPFVQGWKDFIRSKGNKQYPPEKYENLINIHFERSFGGPLFKILGAQARDQGMDRHPHVADAFDSSEKYPTGHFAPFGGHSEWDDSANHWDGHEGIFGKDRDLYLHVKPAPQHATHVDGENTMLDLDDEENRPIHPYIQYLQVKPGAANPGPEHAQQVYEALHRQGYTGDTMDFFAPSDSDGRRDKNGLNRRQRLYRPFVQGWKDFIRAKGYKQYPMAKSLTRRFWERKPQVGAAPPPEPAQDRPSLASRMLGKVKVTRRSGLEGASAIASNPKAAGKIALDMAAPGASAIASGVPALPKVAGGTDLSSLVHRVGSNPSAETWVSSGLGIVRGATTGLLGVLVPGGSKSIASSSVTAGSGVMDGIKKLGSDPDFASGASEWWPRKKGAPHAVLQHAIRLAAAGKQITRRGLSDALVREEMTAPIVRSPSGTFHDIPDLIGPKVSNSSGMSVYVLPAEHQTRHLGPIAHYGSDEKFGSVIQLSGHDAEAEDYKKMSEIMRPILAADKANPYVGGITDLTGNMDHKRGRQIAGTAQPWEEAEPISFDGPEHAFEEFDRKHNENGVGKSIVKKGEAEKERRAKKREKEEQEKRAKKPRYRDDDMASRMAAQERMRTAQDRIRPANRSRLERSLSSMEKSAAWQRKEGKNPKGGLNAKGRASAKREGHNLKAPVKSGDNPRRASFLARMGGSPGPEYDEHGKPTRLLLALRVWGASSKADAKRKAAAMSERLKKKKLAKGRGEDARQDHLFSGAKGFSERDYPTGQMTKTSQLGVYGMSHIGVFGEKRHILVESHKAYPDSTHIEWVHIEPGTKVEPHHITEIFGALHDAGYTKPMSWSALEDNDERFSDRQSSRRDRLFRPLAAQWDKFVAAKQAKMSKAELDAKKPNHNTSGPRSPRWQPAVGPTLTPRQIAIQQRSAQKLAELAALPAGSPQAREATVPKRSRTPLMPRRSQGLLASSADGHVSVAEAARILGIPHSAVTKHIERGTFPARYEASKRTIDTSHPHFIAVRDGLRQGKTMKTILYDLEEKPVTEEEKKDSYGEMYGYPQGKRRYRSSRTRTGTSRQARLGQYQRISPVTGKPSKSTSLGRPPLADPYALFD